MTQIQSDLFKLSETSVKIKEINEDDQIQSIWKTMDANIKQTLPFIE